MKKLITLVMVAAATAVSGQDRLPSRNLNDMITIDSCKMQVDYLFYHTRDTTARRSVFDRHRLDIGKSVTHYYSYNAYRVDSIMNKATRDINPHKHLQRDEKIYCEDVFTNYPRAGVRQTLTGIINTDYLREEPIPELHWTLSEERKSVAGYSCRQATTDFRGRKWIAWFTEEIPTMSGPWKLAGLPGLILEAEDSEGLFKWRAVAIRRGGNAPIGTYNGKHNKIVPVSRRQLIYLQELIWRDYADLHIRHGIEISIMDPKTRTIRRLKSGEYPPRPYIPPLELE